MATINGTAVANLLNGTEAADTISGLGGNDTLNGLAGNDRLDGGLGNDSMVGGADNDLYIVNSTLDKVVEGASAGTDTIQSSVTYTLPANVENLTLTGAGNISATGNTLNNVLTGNTGLNRLTGSSGNDTLNGGGGKDTLIGGTGNDTYIADSTDVITELAGQGTDTLQSTITRTLSLTLANIERLTLTGTANVNGTGNGFNNVLTGNGGLNNLNGGAGNDTLNGGGGKDTLVGGTGNDTYIADSTDVITELASQGTDTLQSTITRTLTGALANIENLTLTGSANVNGTGNGFANILIGNAGNNILSGGAGADQLNGGDGDDVLIWDAADTAVNGGAGADALRLTGSTALDLTAVEDGKILNVEAIDLAGTNTLTLAASDVLALSDESDTLRVDGATGDTVVATGGWMQIENTAIGEQIYAQYTRDGATLQVDLDVDRAGIAVSEMSLSVLDGTNGFRMTGEAAGDRAGISVSAGDVNGDGYDDLIVGADLYGDYTGAAYVVFGAASGIASSFSLSALNGTNGFRLMGGAANDRAGYSTAVMGDLNGDGYDDLLVSAHKYGASDVGAAYVVFGAASGFGSTIQLSDLNGTNGFRLTGELGGDQAGISVSAAGDVNGDGLADILVGAMFQGADNAGAAYVLFGSVSGFASDVLLSSLDGTNGFKLTGETANDFAGFSVSAAGDVNGDGFADILVSAYGYGANDKGAAYVVLGRASGFGPNGLLSTLSGSNGFQLTGETDGDKAGWSASSAGDVNGDGIADLLVGASHYGANDGGTAYVVFGTTTGFDANPPLSALDGTNGFQLTAEADGDRLGISVSAAGDMNGDGYDDLLVGAFTFGTSNNGAAYVVFGGASGFAANFALSALDGTNGFQLTGASNFDNAGNAVSAAGDVNGDGFADVLVGAREYGTENGAAYVVYGRDFTGTADFVGTSAGEATDGTSGADILVGGGGNDTLAGQGGADVFRGGAGNDTIEVTDTGFLDLDGGSGNDKLTLVGNGMTLDLTALGDGRIAGLEQFDITGSGANTLTLEITDILNLSDTTNTVLVSGDSDDVLNVTDGTWSLNDTGLLKFYTLGRAEIVVSGDMTVNITLI